MGPKSSSKPARLVGDPGRTALVQSKEDLERPPCVQDPRGGAGRRSLLDFDVLSILTICDITRAALFALRAARSLRICSAAQVHGRGGARPAALGAPGGGEAICMLPDRGAL